MSAPRPVEDRFWEKVHVRGPEDCWEWQASRHPRGYGQFRLGADMRRAHRVSYMLKIGEIPDGLELDHLCRNTGCVNPRHLEPVTHKENVLRGASPAASHATKTHCPQGHPYREANIFWDAGRRRCRACRNAQHRNAYWRDKAAK